MGRDLCDELIQYILELSVHNNETKIVDLSRLRAVNTAFRDYVDKQIESFLKDPYKMRILGYRGRPSYSFNSLELYDVRPLFSSLRYLAKNKCCICEKPFKGTLKPMEFKNEAIGILAHGKCIRSKCVSIKTVCNVLTPLQPSASRKELNRNFGLKAALEMRGQINKSEIISSLPVITCKGNAIYERNLIHNEFEEMVETDWIAEEEAEEYLSRFKELVFVDKVPMIKREDSLLGWLYETEEELERVVKIDCAWDIEVRKRLLQERPTALNEEGIRELELKKKRQNALQKREQKLQQWLERNNYEIDVPKYYGKEPFKSYLQPLVSAPSFSTIISTLEILPRVDNLLETYELSVHDLPAILPFCVLSALFLRV